MSDMRNYGAVRFKVVEEVSDLTKFYNKISLVLGTPKYLDHKRVWDGSEFLKTDTVEGFEYEEVRGTFVVLKDWDTGFWYVDYVLAGGNQGEEDLNVTISLADLHEIQNKAVELFGSMIDTDCKVVVYDWYTGTDRPMPF